MKYITLCETIGVSICRTVGNEEKDARRQTSVHGAFKEFRLVEEQIQVARRVQFRILEAVDIVDVLVEHSEGQNGQ